MKMNEQATVTNKKDFDRALDRSKIKHGRDVRRNDPYHRKQSALEVLYIYVIRYSLFA